MAIYDDRLEITSPGGLMPGVTIERMKEGYSQIRNRALAHAFSYMNLIEGWGTGIPRLLKEMREYGLAEPEFIDMEMALRINLYRKKIDGETSTENSNSIEFGKNNVLKEERISMDQGREDKTTSERVMSEVKRNPYITQKQLAEMIGISYAGIRYTMKKLQNEGVLLREGSTKKGKWLIRKY